MPKLLLQEIAEHPLYLGVVSALPDYKLAFHINENLNLALAHDPVDFAITHEKGAFLFPRYTYSDNEEQITWHLMRNKAACFKINNQELPINTIADQAKKSIFVKSLQQYDYLIAITGNPQTEMVKSWQQAIRNIKGVSFVSACEPTATESKNLYFESNHESE
ncbi:MAG: IPExxxVDY family protein [Schleiferiaceae bacterium]|nr:IPExxxVDY family protein [Schleiferiaceae bacterium]